jgi:hypothetical protein
MVAAFTISFMLLDIPTKAFRGTRLRAPTAVEHLVDRYGHVAARTCERHHAGSMANVYVFVCQLEVYCRGTPEHCTICYPARPGWVT